MSSDEPAEGRGRGNALSQFVRWILGTGYERNAGGVERAVRYVVGTACLVAAGADLLP